MHAVFLRKVCAAHNVDVYFILFCCFAWNGFVAEWKTIVPGILDVHVNFKIRDLQWSAVQLCGKMSLGKGGGKRQLYNLLLAAAAAFPHQDHSAIHISSGATCTADLDSGVLALTDAQNRPALLQLNRPLGTAVSVSLVFSLLIWTANQRQ